MANYDRVLLELDAGEAHSVQSKSGFYELLHSRKDVFDILGGHVAIEGGGIECDTEGGYGR
jgi:hypothetical protein